jgi:putative ABC transport system ATP-binding protein
MSAPAIELRDVVFSWPGGPAVLDIARLDVARGERVFLRGASGSGKSTLLGIIGGVLQPRQGSVRVLGTELANLRPGARDRFRGDHIGFIFQMFNLIPYLSVLDNVLLPVRFTPQRGSAFAAAGALRDEARRLLAALGLQEQALQRRAVTELSIGQQQRVAAARALLGSPELIIADEPTSSLDYDARADFLQLLMQECARSSATLLFVSHDTSLGSLFDRNVPLRELNRAATPAGAAA